jgi:hypothetical protein
MRLGGVSWKTLIRPHEVSRWRAFTHAPLNMTDRDALHRDRCQISKPVRWLQQVIVALALIVLLGTVSFAETWVLVASHTGKDGNTSHIYVDTDSVRREGEFMRLWTQTRYSASQTIEGWKGICPQCQPTGSLVLYKVQNTSTAIDCAKSTFATTDQSYHSAEGSILQSYNLQRSDRQFSKLIPGTAMAHIRDWVCDRSGRKAKPQSPSKPPQ